MIEKENTKNYAKKKMLKNIGKVEDMKEEVEARIGESSFIETNKKEAL